jgi:chromosome segregation ATPase
MYEGIIKVCDNFAEVESLCFRGYRLVQVLPDDRIEFGSEQTTTHENGYQQIKENVTKPLVLRRSLFVMLQDADQALAAKEAERATAERDARRARGEAEEAGRKAAEQAKLAEKLKRDVDSLDAQFRSRGEEQQRLRETTRKLEADLGKVRAAVGEIRMKEILGAGS